MRRINQEAIATKLQELKETFSLTNQDLTHLEKWLSTEHGIDFKPRRPTFRLPMIALGIVGVVGACSVVGTYISFQRESPSSPTPTISVVPDQSKPDVLTPSAKTVIPYEHGRVTEVKSFSPGKYKYGGSTSWAPVVCHRQGIDQYIADTTGLQLEGTQGGSEDLRQFLDGSLDFAVTSRSRGDLVTTSGVQLDQIQVANDALAFAINPALKSQIQGLTLDQLTNIYKADDPAPWTKFLDNKSLDNALATSVQPFSRASDKSGTVQIMLKALNLSSFGKLVQTVSTTTEGIGRVAMTPGGIYFATATEIFGQNTVEPLRVGSKKSEWGFPYTEKGFSPNKICSDLQTVQPSPLNSNYPEKLIRQIYVIFRVDGGDDEKAARAYAAMLRSKEGQELLQKIGYFPLTSSQLRTAN